jgi:hypothetical protein
VEAGQSYGESAYQAWGLFLRAHTRVVREMDASMQRATGLSLRDYDVLHQLSRHDGPMPSPRWSRGSCSPRAESAGW